MAAHRESCRQNHSEHSLQLLTPKLEGSIYTFTLVLRMEIHGLTLLLQKCEEKQERSMQA